MQVLRPQSPVRLVVPPCCRQPRVPTSPSLPSEPDQTQNRTRPEHSEHQSTAQCTRYTLGDTGGGHAWASPVEIPQPQRETSALTRHPTPPQPHAPSSPQQTQTDRHPLSSRSVACLFPCSRPRGRPRSLLPPGVTVRAISAARGRILKRKV